MSKRQKFTKEFRAESVELFLSSDKSLVEVAASLGINEGTLGNWVRTYRAEHPAAEAEGPATPIPFTADVEQSLARLQQELAAVKRENEFLKAVSAYFAAERKK